MLANDQEHSTVTSTGVLAGASVISALAGMLTFAVYAHLSNRLTDPRSTITAGDAKIAEYFQLATLFLGCISICFALGGYWNRRGHTSSWIPGLLGLCLGIAVLLMSFVMF
jgi:drug/metabolite transporter (DMT)-like permease